MKKAYGDDVTFYADNTTSPTYRGVADDRVLTTDRTETTDLMPSADQELVAQMRAQLEEYRNQR